MQNLNPIIPVLAYRDIEPAHDFLVNACGFEPRGLHRTDDGRVIHGEVGVGSAPVWLHRVTAEHHLYPPQAVDVANAGLFVYVDDVDTHYRCAQEAGAHIDGESVNQPYGQREYVARDLEGHRWWFAAPVVSSGR